MRPHIGLLSSEQIQRVLDEALELLTSPGVRVESPAARQALQSVGAQLDGDVARIPEAIVRQALASAPKSFVLYARAGQPAVRYGGEAVHFDPGSCAVHVLDPITQEHRASQSADLVRLVQVADMLPAYDAQSTAVVCHDAPESIGDVYRLFLVLLHSAKPVVTGAFRADGVPRMAELLALDCGGGQALRARPRAVFDVCPSPPLRWTEFAGQNLVDLAAAGIPAQIVSMPLAGATAPVTLIGAVVQHAAECLSGIVIHQAAGPGAPVVWGGAPAIFDMRAASTPMGAIETAMIDIACAQVGKSLGLPTHTYLGASDAKSLDSQSGLESGITAVLGALAGINMISGAGMLDFLACQSAEKLVLDAEAIEMSRRLTAGIVERQDRLAAATFSQVGLTGDFLKLRETRDLFRLEQYLPSAVIDRGSLRAWADSGRRSSADAARRRVESLLQDYQTPALDANADRAMREWMSRLASAAGMDRLPGTQPRL